MGPVRGPDTWSPPQNWVAAKELNESYQNKDTYHNLAAASLSRKPSSPNNSPP